MSFNKDYPSAPCSRTLKTFRSSFLLLFSILFTACAGPNPNPGERTVDVLRNDGNYEKSLKLAKEQADQGFPWAQLRMGLMYENGLGVKKNVEVAIEWYRKAAIQKSTGNWAEGQMVGATGKAGFFNQNSDARVAQFQLANLYLKRNTGRDLIDAYLAIRTVKEETKGQPVFFCCEFMGGYSIGADQIAKTYGDVTVAMTNKQKQAAEAEYQTLGKKY